MQQVELKVSIPIDIPEDYVLLTKEDFDMLQQQLLMGVYWNMKDLEKRIGKKQDWIKERILYNPAFKHKLDAKNNGPVSYPSNRGAAWTFHALKMTEFLDSNFKQIFND